MFSEIPESPIHAKINEDAVKSTVENQEDEPQSLPEWSINYRTDADEVDPIRPISICKQQQQRQQRLQTLLSLLLRLAVGVVVVVLLDPTTELQKSGFCSAPL